MFVGHRASLPVPVSRQPRSRRSLAMSVWDRDFGWPPPERFAHPRTRSPRAAERLRRFVQSVDLPHDEAEVVDAAGGVRVLVYRERVREPLGGGDRRCGLVGRYNARPRMLRQPRAQEGRERGGLRRRAVRPRLRHRRTGEHRASGIQEIRYLLEPAPQLRYRARILAEEQRDDAERCFARVPHRVARASDFRDGSVRRLEKRANVSRVESGTAVVRNLHHVEPGNEPLERCSGRRGRRRSWGKLGVVRGLSGEGRRDRVETPEEP